MKKIIIGVIILSSNLHIFLKAQQDSSLTFQLSSFTYNIPSNITIDPPSGRVISETYLDSHQDPYEIHCYVYFTNSGGPGKVNVTVSANQFTKNGQVSVREFSNFRLESYIPVAGGGYTNIIMSLLDTNIDRSKTDIIALDTPRIGCWWMNYLPSYDGLQNYENIAFANNMFMAIGNYGVILTSSDGQNWAGEHLAVYSKLSGVTYGDGLWVITTWDSLIYTSTDTRIWQPGINVSDWLSGVSYGNGRFVAVGGSMYTSVNGTNWDKVGDSYNFSGINFINNTFIAVGDGIFSSTTGTLWTQVLQQPPNGHISGIAYGNGIYLAVGWNWDAYNGLVYKSLNGSDWIQQTLNVADIKRLDKVAFGDGYFIAVGDSGAIIQSTDGVNWTLIPTGTNKRLNGISFGKNQFAVVGNDNAILNSRYTLLPVELTSFTAIRSSSGINLKWKTVTEVNNFGFDIERRQIGDDNWRTIGFIKGNGISNVEHIYSYSDVLSISGRYIYRLKQIDNDGIFKYSNEVEILIERPSSFVLRQSFPNPFNPTTTISFDLPWASFVSLKVFDLTGREIALLVNGKLPAGNHTYQWNAINISSGLYFYKFQAGSYTETKKMILLR